MEKFGLLALLILIIGCRNSQETTTYQKISGQTMGTTYQVTYQSNQDIRQIVETTLKEVNKGVNHYDPTSTISRVNQSVKKQLVLDPTVATQHFFRNLTAAKEIFRASEGAFDPTVMPLVNYWGFGYTPKKAVTQVDSVRVDSLLQLVGFNKIQFQDKSIEKRNPTIQLDFSALAKGYGVDQVGEALEAQGIPHYLVDIGGEVRAKGVNAKGIPWRLGINTPQEDAAITDFLAVIALDNLSMATSGNYRNFYEVDGIKYAHTINPKTGYPEKSKLLSATVIAKDCMMADGYATAFMTMGLEKAFALATTQKDIHAYFLYLNEGGNIEERYTENIKPFIVE